VAEFHCRKLLVTLDGLLEHEQGMQVAVGLAQACPADLHLLMVIPNFADLKGEQAAASRMTPGATSAVLDMAEQGGEEYLRQHLEKLKQIGIRATAEITRGDPVNMIVNTAREVGANLIVLGTHGKTGMDAFWSGSVTPKISGRSSVPLLLVPVRETGAS
jgi:nucleotide-binding universal stress UspA family protein